VQRFYIKNLLALVTGQPIDKLSTNASNFFVVRASFLVRYRLQFVSNIFTYFELQAAGKQQYFRDSRLFCQCNIDAEAVRLFLVCSKTSIQP
jgi:hypothetical protein